MTDQTPATKLPPSCFIKVDGKEHEIFMSFALLNRLAFLVGDIDNIGMIHINPEMREAFMKELMAERSKGGKITKEVQIDDVEISLDDIQLALDFASEHVLDFTLGALEKSMLLQQRNQGRMLNLKSTASGLSNSLSKS